MQEVVTVFMAIPWFLQVAVSLVVLVIFFRIFSFIFPSRVFKTVRHVEGENPNGLFFVILTMIGLAALLIWYDNAMGCDWFNSWYSSNPCSGRQPW